VLFVTLFIGFHLNAIAILRGGAAEWMSFRALRGSEGYGACADEGASIAFG